MENNKPRLLVIGPRGVFGYEGGIEKFTDAFLPRALKYADIDVLSLHPAGISCPAGLRVINVPKSKRFKTDKALYIFYTLYNYMVRRYDHVFIFGTNFAVLIPLLKAVFWRKAKIHLRSGSVDHLLDKWGAGMKFFMRHTEKFCRYADTVIAVAPNIKRHLESLDVTTHLVRNGIDRQPDNKPLSAREPDAALAVGRVTMQKNYKVLVEAASILDADGPDITVIGGADLTDEAQALQKFLAQNPDSKINFAGAKHRDEVLQALQEKSLYINCSIHEGMSNAVLEAIQNGIPLILSDIEANRDFDLPDHIYFDPHDPKALSEKISDALSNPDRYLIDQERFQDWDDAIDGLLQLTGVIE